MQVREQVWVTLVPVVVMKMTLAHTKKRKVTCVPKLIDNKRKHLQKKLSADQGDELPIKEAKEDALFQKNWLTQC